MKRGPRKRSGGGAGRREHTGKCRGKVRYPDHARAVLALHGVQNAAKRDRTPGRVYECDTCRGWHLTAAERWGNGR